MSRSSEMGVLSLAFMVCAMVIFITYLNAGQPSGVLLDGSHHENTPTSSGATAPPNGHPEDTDA